MDKFKIRASAGQVMLTNPRSKADKESGKLSKTTITYIETWLKERIYGARKEISSKYLEKGIVMEDKAIDKAIEWLNLPFTLANEKSFEDEYFTGTPDIILKDEIIDIKNSWDFTTFPLFEKSCPTPLYETQLQIYMHLTGKRKARVVYLLLNTPEELTWEEPMDYSGIDPKYRIKAFSVDYDPKVISKLQERVIVARKLLETDYKEYYTLTK